MALDVEELPIFLWVKIVRSENPRKPWKNPMARSLSPRTALSNLLEDGVTDSNARAVMVPVPGCEPENDVENPWGNGKSSRNG